MLAAAPSALIPALIRRGRIKVVAEDPSRNGYIPRVAGLQSGLVVAVSVSEALQVKWRASAPTEFVKLVRIFRHAFNIMSGC